METYGSTTLKAWGVILLAVLLAFQAILLVPEKASADLILKGGDKLSQYSLRNSQAWQ